MEQQHLPLTHWSLCIHFYNGNPNPKVKLLLVHDWGLCGGRIWTHLKQLVTNCMICEVWKWAYFLTWRTNDRIHLIRGDLANQEDEWSIEMQSRQPCVVSCDLVRIWCCWWVLYGLKKKGITYYVMKIVNILVIVIGNFFWKCWL